MEADAKATTYVAVSLRKWPGRAAWRRKRIEQGTFRDVRAYDASDLETWLDEAPAEGLRVATLLGKAPPGACALSDWWEDWRCETNPRLVSAVLLAGRQDAVAAIGRWLAGGESPTLAIWADTMEEAIAFTSCAVDSLPQIARDVWTTRAIVVSDSETWRLLAPRSGALLLIPTFYHQTAIGRAVRYQHRVVAPYGRATHQLGEGIPLPPLDRPTLQAALQAMGINSDRADDLARTGRGGLQALRRALGHRPERSLPSWVDTELADALLPLLLVGHWSDTNVLDQRLLTTMSGTGYADVQLVLTRALAQDDPPVRRSADYWRFPARRDAWTLLAARLTPQHLGRFASVALEVLQTADPRWDLPPETRWTSFVDKTPRVTSEARQGLVETLALLALEPGPPGHRACAIGVIQRVLQEGRRNWKTWATLGRGIADLAELEPEAFLKTVTDSLADPVREVLKLFGHDRSSADPFGDQPLHTALLWSLERLAWSPKYLAGATVALGILARLDPGGKYLNRPAASLRSIYLPWYPQTNASPAERDAALDALQAAEPESAFQLFLSVLPGLTGDMSMPTGSPRWRPWKGSGRGEVLRSDYAAAISGFVKRLVALAAEQNERWTSLVKHFDALPNHDRVAVLSSLREQASQLSTGTRELVWNALRDLVNKHRAFADAQWALPAEVVNEWAELLPLVEPEDPVVRHAWLFANHPQVPTTGEWAEREAYIAARQQGAVQEILDARGLDGLRDLASRVEQPGFLGRTLGRRALPIDTEDAVLARDFGPERTTPPMFARGFIGGRLEYGGAQWRTTVLARHREHWTAEQIATLYLYGPSGPETWDRVDQEPAAVQEAFWQNFPPLGLGPKTDVLRLAHKYLSHGRPAVAVQLFGLYSGEVSDEAIPLVITALERTVAEFSETLPALRHDITRVLARLAASKDRAVRERVAAFEWQLLPLILEAHRHHLVLYEQMALDPCMFVELCTLAFTAADGPVPTLNEGERARAMQAYRLLKSWHGPPSTLPGEDLAYPALRAWIDTARSALRACGRGVIGDLRIGELLILPGGIAQESWPHPAICQAIQELSCDDIDRGFELAVTNGRGVYQPSAGREERQIAARYRERAGVLQLRWPRMAHVLLTIAESYEAWAHREEEEESHSQDS